MQDGKAGVGRVVGRWHGPRGGAAHAHIEPRKRSRDLPRQHADVSAEEGRQPSLSHSRRGAVQRPTVEGARSRATSRGRRCCACDRAPRKLGCGRPRFHRLHLHAALDEFEGGKRKRDGHPRACARQHALPAKDRRDDATLGIDEEGPAHQAGMFFSVSPAPSSASARFRAP